MNALPYKALNFPNPFRIHAAIPGMPKMLSSKLLSGSLLSTPERLKRATEAHAGHCFAEFPIQLQSWQR
jgi:hypothetical protein